MAKLNTKKAAKTTKAAKTAKATTKATRAPKVAHDCACGCGEQTFRTFKPGHDARHKGNLLRAALGGDSRAERELQDRNWGHFLEASQARQARLDDARAKREQAKAAAKATKTTKTTKATKKAAKVA